MKTQLSSGLLCLLSLFGCNSQREQSSAAEPQIQGAVAPTANAPSPAPATVSVAGLANCEATAPLTSAIERVAQLADTNGDGEVAKAEATALSNFALGGAFFRADANGDGTVSPEEGRAVRAELLQRYPELEALVLAARASGRKTFALPQPGTSNTASPSPSRTFAPLPQRSSTTIRIADKNNSGSIGIDEARATTSKGARALVAPLRADRQNQDGALSQEELTS